LSRLFSLFGFPGSSNKTNQTNQTDQMNQMNQTRSDRETRMPSRLLWGAIWAVSLFLLPGTAHVAFAQEPTPQSQDRGSATVPDGREAEAAVQSDEPALIEEDEESIRRRRFLKRLSPQPLTPEQQAEAKRLSAIAARMGTDPTAIIGRFETRHSPHIPHLRKLMIKGLVSQ
jgi:hypothetical protein